MRWLAILPRCLLLAPAGGLVAGTLVASFGCGRLGVDLLPLPDSALDAPDAADAALGGGDEAGTSDAAGDAPRDADASDADTAGSSDAGAVVRGARLLVDNSSSSARLDYPVRFSVDTATLIAQGLLAPDCSTLRIFGGSDCASERAFFLPEHGCNSTTTEIWVRVPSLPDHGREVLRVAFDQNTSTRSNGSTVFDFFDGFDGNSLDRSRWTSIGTGSVSVSAGLLRGTGVVLLQSVAAQVRAGTDALGVRIAATSEVNRDVELGVGTFFSAARQNDLWAYSRSWEGLSFVSYVETTDALAPPASTGCPRTSAPGARIGPAWVDRPPMSASPLVAEFRYAVVSQCSEAWLESPRSGTLHVRSDVGCTLPNQLPILIGLDQTSTGPVVEQTLDYVYVRPTSAPEPTTSVLLDSAISCGSQ